MLLPRGLGSPPPDGTSRLLEGPGAPGAGAAALRRSRQLYLAPRHNTHHGHRRRSSPRSLTLPRGAAADTNSHGSGSLSAPLCHRHRSAAGALAHGTGPAPGRGASQPTVTVPYTVLAQRHPARPAALEGLHSSDRLRTHWAKNTRVEATRGPSARAPLARRLCWAGRGLLWVRTHEPSRQPLRRWHSPAGWQSSKELWSLWAQPRAASRQPRQGGSVPSHRAASGDAGPRRPVAGAELLFSQSWARL